MIGQDGWDGPNGWSTHGLSILPFLDLDLEFCRCHQRSKVQRTNPRCSSWSSYSSHGLEDLLDLLFQVLCLLNYPYLEWMWTRSSWCFKSWMCTICTGSSTNFNGTSPKMKSIWGTSIIYSSWAISWAITITSSSIVLSGFSGRGLTIRSIKWSVSFLDLSNSSPTLVDQHY